MIYNRHILLQDEKDFAAAPPVYYGVLEGVTRPRLGCRILVVRNISKILPGLLNDLNTWVDETRLKSVRLLYSLLLYSGVYYFVEVLQCAIFIYCYIYWWSVVR